MTPLLFMLALFSTLFRWLGFFRVRALMLSIRLHDVEMSRRFLNRWKIPPVLNWLRQVFSARCFAHNFHGHIIEQFVPSQNTTGKFAMLAAANVPRLVLVIESEDHAPESASARARRQGTGVLERPRKRQRLMRVAA